MAKSHFKSKPYIITLALLYATACGGRIEREPLLDEDGKKIPTPPPLEQWLQIESITPTGGTSLSTSPTFLIRLNQYLQEDSARSYAVVSLQTGGRGVGGAYTPIMTERALLWSPNNPLRDGFEYTLTVSGEGLESVTGAPTPPSYSTSVTFLAEEMVTPNEVTSLDLALEPGWGEVEALFEQKGCYTCHGEASWHELNPLTYNALVGKKSAQSDLYLVRFKDPVNSYLMHKLLPDYPIRRGTAQPPEWAEMPASNEPLTKDELWLVERWIRRGAPL